MVSAASKLAATLSAVGRAFSHHDEGDSQPSWASMLLNGAQVGTPCGPASFLLAQVISFITRHINIRHIDSWHVLKPWNSGQERGEYMKLQAGKQFYKLVVVAWLTFSFGSVVLGLVSWHQLSVRMDYGKEVTLTRDELHEVYISLLDLETGERGYVITGDKNFLNRFNAAETNLPAHFEIWWLWCTTTLNCWRVSRSCVRMLKPAATGQHEVIDLREKSFDKAAAMVSAGKLKNMMDDLRSQLAKLDETCQNRQLSIRQEIFQPRVSRESSHAGRGRFRNRRRAARAMAFLRCRPASGTRTRID